MPYLQSSPSERSYSVDIEPVSMLNRKLKWPVDIFCLCKSWALMQVLLIWCCWCCLVAQSCLTLCNPWTIACQAPLSLGFSRQESWSGLPFPFPGDLPDLGMEFASPALAGRFHTLSHQVITLSLMRPQLVRSKASWISKGFSACMLLTHLPSSQGPYSEDEVNWVSGSPGSSPGPAVYVCVSLLLSPLGHLHWFSENCCSSSDSYKMNAYRMCAQLVV